MKPTVESRLCLLHLKQESFHFAEVYSFQFTSDIFSEVLVLFLNCRNSNTRVVDVQLRNFEEKFRSQSLVKISPVKFLIKDARWMEITL